MQHFRWVGGLRAGNCRVSRRIHLSLTAIVLAAMLAASIATTAIAAPAKGAPTSTDKHPALITAKASDNVVLPRLKLSKTLSAGSVSYYARKYKVSQSLARQRLVTQQTVPNLEQKLKTSLGSSFAQVWFDNSAGQWVVAVDSASAPITTATTAGPATTASAESTTAALMSSVGLSGAYRVETVPFDEAEMESGIQYLTAQLSRSESAGGYTVGAGDGSIDLKLASDAPTAPAEQAVAGLSQSGNPVPVNVNTSPLASLAASPDVSCTQFPWCDSVVGGIAWESATGWECSAAYNVTSPGDPYPLFLTAGHCDIVTGDYGQWWTCNGTGGCGWYGHQIPYYYYGTYGGDAGLIENDSYPIYPGYVNWGDDAGVSTLNSYETSSAPNGTVVCLNAAITYGCGTVTDYDASVSYSAEPASGLPQVSLTGMIDVDGDCSVPGDSGGTVNLASDETAVGIDSGGDGEYGDCGPNNYVEPISRALSTLGVSLDLG